MTHHYSDLGGASDWSCRVGNLLQPVGSTAQIWVVTRHHYGISALVSQTSFRGETSCDVAKCRPSSQAKAREQVGFSRTRRSHVSRLRFMTSYNGHHRHNVGYRRRENGWKILTTKL